ncbi:MAG: PqqD family protein [Acidimicrobiia bacterium]
MESSQTIRRNDRVVFRELAGDEGGVLLHLDSGAYHGLNAIGTVIWDLIGDGSSFGTLVDAVRARLTDAPDALEADVTAFIEDLVERDLLRLPEA